MVDVMSMFDSRWLQSFDLADSAGRARDYTMRIARVEGVELMVSGGSKSRKPALYFVGAKKALALNKTNARTLISLYGRDVERWVGRWVTLYPTTTKFGSDSAVPCIRVRPTIPKEGAAGGDHLPDRPPNEGELSQKAAAASSARQIERQPGED
jgi:hypothetical protein